MNRQPAWPKWPVRARVSQAFYRRTRLPFRLAFGVVARLRGRRRANVLDQEEVSSDYLTAHVREFFREQWVFGYHRVFDLVRHFQPLADPGSLRVLSLGPRTEIEFYYLWLLFGFRWGRISGADLVSTSPKIQAADMSVRLPFPDDTFDVLVASHSLEKSNNPERTRDEIRRVVRPNGWVLVGGDNMPQDATTATWPPVRYFRDGVQGLIELYGVRLEEIEYLKVHSPHGFEIIFRVRK
jgi:hypothetical protein